MNDIHALSGAYAVDAVDDLERARFDRHLAECPACQAEVASLREAAARLSLTTEVAPPAGMRDRVLHDIRSVRPLPPEVPQATGSTASSTTSRRHPLRALAAAAAAVVLVGTGATVAWQASRDDSSVTAQPSATQQVLQAADAQRVTASMGNGATATLVRSRSMNQAVLLAKDLPPAPSGKVYELWLQDGHRVMQPAGLLPDGASTVLLSGDAADAIGAGITVEPAGGSKVPSSEPVAFFSLKKA